ncbi:hypothetical protein SAMN05720473_1061 [Fibrobacter sp. UWB15]|nr:hypothetical protein BGW99_1051 [Fibrobacter sp. UWB6]SHG14294.1 hypothetical protein SAMN05720760_1051 [Fibrobacter sp. UWB8]SMG31882.1 hypothetical protein SAMN05720473_1061 [Fibrobacter sp. UWB15]
MLKRACLFFIALSCAVFAADLGTAENPLTIDNENDLVLLRNAVNAGSGTFKGVDVSDGATDLYFKLVRDLDLSTVCGKNVGNWTPIGTYEHPFKGSFDGNGKTVDYLYINEPLPERGDTAIGYYGLFGVASTENESKTVISNLTIGENSRIVSERDGDVGAIVGLARNNVRISDCKNKAYVSGRSAVGGIVGFAANAPLPDGVNIKNCVNEGFVGGARKAGGIVGAVTGFGVHIDSCTNLGGVSSADTAAGIVAADYSSVMTPAKLNYLINKGNVSSGKISGGIIAVTADGGASIANCFNSGYVQASTSAAGIVGHLKSMYPQTVLTCVNSGGVFAGTNAGGIVGFIAASSPGYITVSQSLNLGVINAGAYAGGIVGNNNSGVFYADHNMNAGAVGFGYAGGIVGWVKAGATEKVSANLSIAAPDTFAIYDSVMSHFEEDCQYPIDAAHAYVTDSLISGKTIADLDDSLWVYKEGYYPQIKTLAENPMKEIRDAQQVASTPVRLGLGDDVAHITKNMGYTVKDAAENAVDVYSARGNISFVNDSVAMPYSLGADTLYVLNENATKKIIVNVTATSNLGTVENPLTISSVEELLLFRKALADTTKYKGVLMDAAGARLAFKITKDLDLSSVCGLSKGNWTPIKNFLGKLNGANHKISNLYIDIEDSLSQVNGGLFETIIAADTAIVENLVLENVHIRLAGGRSAGAIAGYMGGNVGIIRNNTSDGIVYSDGTAGGLVASTGLNDFFLQNNLVEGSVEVVRADSTKSQGAVGGMIGFTNGLKASVTGNVNRADIKGTYVDAMSGILGVVYAQSTIENNINEGNLTGAAGSYLGGIAGEITSSVRFVDNHNKGDIKVDSYAEYVCMGGSVGFLAEVYSNDGVVENNSNTGNIDVSLYAYLYDKYVGGVFGRYIHTKASDLVNKGHVSAQIFVGENAYVGGVLASAEASTDSVLLESIVNEGAVDVYLDTSAVYSIVGGVLGYTETKYVDIQDAMNKGKVSVEKKDNSSSYVGGVAGMLNSRKVRLETSFNFGDVYSHGGGLYTGGLVGALESADTLAVVQKCGNEGNLYAAKDKEYTRQLSMGGLIGLGLTLTISESYNSGDIHAGYKMDELDPAGRTASPDYVGGLVGFAGDAIANGDISFFRIEKSVNIGDVIFETSANNTYYVGVGGIVGYTKSLHSEIENVANYGSVSTKKSLPSLWMGGIVGLSYNYMNMKNIVNGGTLSFDDDAKDASSGSLVGANDKIAPDVASSVLLHGYTHLENPELYHAENWDSAVVDLQWARLDTNEAYTRRLTAELTADSLPSVLNAENWIQVEGCYPQLKALAESPVEAIRKISALGATPAYLKTGKEDYEHADLVWSPFAVATKNALGETAVWTSNVSQVVLNADTVSFKALDHDTVAVLTVAADGYKKSVWVSLMSLFKKNLDFSKVKWDYTAPFTYDGKAKAVSLSGLPEQVKATYCNDSATVPGTYVARVTLQYDTALYNAPVFMDSLRWVINKDTLDLSKIVWSKTVEFDFDSTEHSVKLENVPEQVAVDYADASQTKPGEYHAMAVLRYDTSLYVGKDYKDSVLVWKIIAGPTKLVAAITAPNSVSLVRHGTGAWTLEFTQNVPANARVSVVGIDGKRISAKVVRNAQSIALQGLPANGIAIVRVAYPGMSKTFKINLR